MDRYANLLALALVAALGLAPVSLAAADREYVVRWLPPTNVTIDGYRVQLTPETRDSSRSLDLGWVPSDADGVGRYTLVLAAEAGHFVTMTAYNAAGESQPSNEIFVPASACDPSACDDGNACSADDCGASGCSNAPLPDGTLCGPNGEACFAGICEAIQCLADAACDNGNPCDGAESCKGFVCAAGAPPSCGEPNQCAAPICDPNVGCLMLPVPDGTACDDGDPSTRREKCKRGVCGGVAKTTGRGRKR
jgi:hypothetical protein